LEDEFAIHRRLSGHQLLLELPKLVDIVLLQTQIRTTKQRSVTTTIETTAGTTESPGSSVDPEFLSGLFASDLIADIGGVDLALDTNLLLQQSLNLVNDFFSRGT
jgi:hypothetical protein